MRVRAVQVIRDGETVIYPGEFIEGRAQTLVDQWIEDGFAVYLPEDNEKPKKSKGKEVKHG